MTQANLLSIFCDIFFNISHVAKYLTDNGITRSAPLEFDDEKSLLIPADCQYVYEACLGWKLLSYLFPLVLIDHVVLSKLCLLPVFDKELFEVLLQCECDGILLGARRYAGHQLRAPGEHTRVVLI